MASVYTYFASAPKQSYISQTNPQAYLHDKQKRICADSAKHSASTFTEPSSCTNTFTYPQESDAPVVLMVSGGADSCALLLKAVTGSLDIHDGRGSAPISKNRLCVLHVNHMLRGKDADDDAMFVQQLSDRFGVPCYIERVDIRALAQKKKLLTTNIEAIGRDVRYALATRLAKIRARESHTPYREARILTAHTANDRAETFLINATKGASLAGLTSIPRVRGNIVRPLLDYTHEDLCLYLKTQGIHWREDATNADTTYVRAHVRHEILPRLKEKNAHVIETIAANCDTLTEEHAFLQRMAYAELRRLTRIKTEHTCALDALLLAKCDIVLARRIVKLAIAELFPNLRMDAAHINEILRKVAQFSGSVSLSAQAEARVEEGILFLRTTDIPHVIEPAWLSVPGSVSICDANGITHLLSARLRYAPQGVSPEAFAKKISRDSDGLSVVLDAQKAGMQQGCHNAVWVDTPRVADTMCPLGMSGRSKKLSDLMQEAHIPAHERAYVPCVRTGPRDEIMWVGRIRPDERFRVDSNSSLLLELRLQKI